jgi:hypothetical protein
VSLFFSFFKTGIAGDWAAKRLTEYDDDQEDVNVATNAKRWTTLKEVRVQFKKDFKAIAAEAEARNIIQKARMKGIDLAEYTGCCISLRTTHSQNFSLVTCSQGQLSQKCDIPPLFRAPLPPPLLVIKAQKQIDDTANAMRLVKAFEEVACSMLGIKNAISRQND